MNGVCSQICQECPRTQRLVCHCLQVTEEMVVETLTTLGIRSVEELREVTGAGAGCTACQRRLRKYIDEYAYSPICSAK
ncbi:MAG: (2Fe-2S)-binding protein [Gemmataceae bacterium]